MRSTRRPPPCRPARPACPSTIRSTSCRRARASPTIVSSESGKPRHEVGHAVAAHGGGDEFQRLVALCDEERGQPDERAQEHDDQREHQRSRPASRGRPRRRAAIPTCKADHHCGKNSRDEQRAGQRADHQRQRQRRQGEQEDEEAPSGTVVCHGERRSSSRPVSRLLPRRAPLSQRTPPLSRPIPWRPSPPWRPRGPGRQGSLAAFFASSAAFSATSSAGSPPLPPWSLPPRRARGGARGLGSRALQRLLRLLGGDRCFVGRFLRRVLRFRHPGADFVCRDLPKCLLTLSPFGQKSRTTSSLWPPASCAAPLSLSSSYHSSRLRRSREQKTERRRLDEIEVSSWCYPPGASGCPRMAFSSPPATVMNPRDKARSRGSRRHRASRR